MELETRAAPPASSPGIPNYRLAMIILLVAEAMLFTGLVGAYLVLRHTVPMWPPEGQPILPMWAGTTNLILLAVGSAGIHYAVRGARLASHFRIVRGITVCLGTGVAFLGVLAVEWVRLSREGLSLESGGTYGALFYTLTGCHALHVVAVLIWVASLLVLALKDRFSPAHHAPVEMAAIFWHFVAVAWLFLFVVLYVA
jgi:cytochrome c oxidase subunit III